jgi:uncharacterized protein YchJ
LNPEKLKEEKVSLKEKIKAERVTKRNKIGRNQKCICGSGKKYKKCCFNKQQVRNLS